MCVEKRVHLQRRDAIVSTNDRHKAPECDADAQLTYNIYQHYTQPAYMLAHIAASADGRRSVGLYCTLGDFFDPTMVTVWGSENVRHVSADTNNV